MEVEEPCSTVITRPPSRSIAVSNEVGASDGGAGDGFGWSVGISGGVAIVGAPEDDDPFTAAGAAYLFDATSGQQLAKILASDGALADEFGHGVAISGSTAVIGAWGDADAGFYSSDSAWSRDQGGEICPNSGIHAGWHVFIFGKEGR